MSKPVLAKNYPKIDTGRNRSINILHLVQNHRWAYGAGALLLLVTNCFALAIPWVIKWVVDHIQDFSGAADLNYLKKCAYLILIFAVIHAALRIGSRIIIFGAGRDIEALIRRRVYNHLQNLDKHFFDHNPTGELISLLTNDINVVRLLFGMGFLNLVNGILLYFLAASVMFVLNPYLAFWAMLPFVLIILVLMKLAPQFFVKSLIVQEEVARLTEFINENLNGQQVIRSYAIEARQIERFKPFNDRYMDASMDLTKIRGILFTSTGAIGGLGTLLLLWVGGQQVIEGVISFGDFVAFFGFLTLLIMPTLMFGFVISIWNRGRASLSRLRCFLATEPIIQEPENPQPMVPGGVIEFKNLSFSYTESSEEKPAGEDVLHNINLAVPEGQLTALVGPLACGKSTLVSLMAKMYPVADGSIRINGQDINQLKISDIRGHISCAPQEIFLFSMSVEENIAFGAVDGVDPATLKRSAERAILIGGGGDKGENPITLDSRVGERGVLLSGGAKTTSGFGTRFCRRGPNIGFR